MRRKPRPAIHALCFFKRPAGLLTKVTFNVFFAAFFAMSQSRLNRSRYRLFTYSTCLPDLFAGPIFAGFIHHTTYESTPQ